MTDGWIIDDFTMIQKEAEKARKEEGQNDEMRPQQQADLDRQG